MRRVGRLKVQLYRGLVRFQTLPDYPCVVNTAIVYHQQNLPVCFLSDLLRKLPEDLRRDRTFPHGVLELALRPAGRQPVEAEAPAGHPPDGGLTARAPGAPGHALRSQAGLVGADEQGSPLLDTAKDLGKLWVFPPLHVSGLVLLTLPKVIAGLAVFNLAAAPRTNTHINRSINVFYLRNFCMEPACDSCSYPFMKFPTFPDFRRIPHRSRPPLGKLVVIQARHGKSLRALAKEFGIGIRTIRTWLRL